jgi:hypothetical protein
MILFVVNDAGPAKYLAYIMSAFDKSQYNCIASNVSAKVLDRFSIEYCIEDDEIALNDISLIITGSRFEYCIDDK